MGRLHLRPRYQRLAVDEGVQYVEGNFERAFVDWQMDPSEAGLVLVDCWDRHPIVNHLERVVQICRERIVPVVNACRSAGVAVIHGPSMPQARTHEQWTKYASDAELFPRAGEAPEWPPQEFRKKSGDYAQFDKPAEPVRDAWIEEYMDGRKIIEMLDPLPEDFVIATGEQLHRLCRHRGIVHLFYCGFAANMCVMMRDYGMREFNRRGYNLVILRDATTAIEAATTVDDLALTEAAIVEVEMLLGFSITSTELVTACERAAGER